MPENSNILGLCDEWKEVTPPIEIVRQAIVKIHASDIQKKILRAILVYKNTDKYEDQLNDYTDDYDGILIRTRKYIQEQIEAGCSVGSINSQPIRGEVGCHNSRAMEVMYAALMRSISSEYCKIFIN